MLNISEKFGEGGVIRLHSNDNIFVAREELRPGFLIGKNGIQVLDLGLSSACCVLPRPSSC